MSISLMKQYDKLVTPFTVGELVPMGIKISPLDLVKQDEGSTTGVDVTNMDWSPSIMKNIAKGSLTFTGAMCLEFLNLFLLYAGGDIIPGTITYTLMDNFFEGEVKNRPEPLSIQELQDFPNQNVYLDPKVTLLHTLKEMLPKYGLPAPTVLESEDILLQASNYGLKSILQVEILRVQFRECEIDSTFYVEVANRIRLLDLTTNGYLYNKVLLYTGLNTDLRHIYFNQSYELPIFESTKCRNLKDYFNESGRRILREEINKAVSYSIERFCQDLGLKP
jgi:hypothetical protein